MTGPDDPWPPDPRTIDLDDGFWLTLKQAEWRLKKSESTLRRMAKNDKVAVCIGSRLWFDLRRMIRPSSR